MTSVGSILLLRTDQIIVHGPCTNHQCRFYRITSTKLFAIQTILPLCIHAICANYSLKALWHLPNYVSNLCIVESWFRKVKAALDYLFIHWLNPCRTKPCVTPHVQLFGPVRCIRWRDRARNYRHLQTPRQTEPDTLLYRKLLRWRDRARKLSSFAKLQGNARRVINLRSSLVVFSLTVKL